MFTPRREHARFCSARCRVAWNRGKLRDPKAGSSALRWSVTAMGETVDRLPRVRAWDLQRAFAVIGEMVWWVTIVDATLVRHYPEEYDSSLEDQEPAERELIERTLAGLRSVRNRSGHELDLSEFIEPAGIGPAPGKGRITEWLWKTVPEPIMAAQPPRGREWELTRYEAYQSHLAGHTIGETFGRAAGFLRLAAASAPEITDATARAAR